MFKIMSRSEQSKDTQLKTLTLTIALMCCAISAIARDLTVAAGTPADAAMLLQRELKRGNVIFGEAYQITEAKRTGENELTVWMTTSTADYRLTCKFRDDVSPITPEALTMDRNYTSCRIPTDGLELLNANTAVFFARQEGEKTIVNYAFDVASVVNKGHKKQRQ